MKRRVFILLIVALLLPIRGALAGVGILCHVGGGSVEHGLTEHSHHQSEGATVSSSHSHAVPHEHPAAPDGPAQPDACKYCTAVCSVPPIAPGDLSFRGPDATGGDRFAALQVSALSPYVSGLERPPRTI